MFEYLDGAIITNMELVVLITETIVTLHNFLMFNKISTGNEYCTVSFVENYCSWEMEKTKPIWRRLTAIANIDSTDAKLIRGNFGDYVGSKVGSIPLQLDMINSTTNAFDK